MTTLYPSLCRTDDSESDSAGGDLVPMIPRCKKLIIWYSKASNFKYYATLGLESIQKQTSESIASRNKQKLKLQKFGLHLQRFRCLPFASQSSNQLLMGMKSRTVTNMQQKYQMHCKANTVPMYPVQNERRQKV